MGVAHFLIVERAELDAYRAGLGSFATILELPEGYRERYDVCDDLGLTKGPGPGPARNFAWDHAAAAGAAWHWVMDDNIDGFYRLQNNLKVPCLSPAFFRAQEAFVESYSNVTMAGPNYFMFASRKQKARPFVLNTRIYSCNLIRNDAPYRWRARYNEDTDLSIRMLRDGNVTVLFNAFLQFKITTQQLGGGNTAEFYAAEGTLPKSRMQVALHPDISELVWRFGRWHHFVDYSIFAANRPRLRHGVSLPEESDEFGMQLEIDDER